MATFKIGDVVLWHGKARTVDGERCTDREVYELRLWWDDASGHLRRGWVAASACKAIGAPSPTAEACAVGKRGAFSQRQDVSEAAARVKARLLGNLPPEPGAAATTATLAPSTAAPAPGRVPCPHDTGKGDSIACDATGPCPADSDIDCTIPAPAPSADPICPKCAAKDEEIVHAQEWGDGFFRTVINCNEMISALAPHMDAGKPLVDRVIKLATDRKIFADVVDGYRKEVAESNDLLQASGILYASTLTARIALLLKQTADRTLECEWKDAEVARLKEEKSCVLTQRDEARGRVGILTSDVNRVWWFAVVATVAAFLCGLVAGGAL